MSVYQLICAIGIPSLCATFALYVIRGVTLSNKRAKALELGVQAILRDKLYTMYDKYSELGYTNYQARENFCNIYKQYHCLGANGQMDDIKDRFCNLPIHFD